MPIPDKLKPILAELKRGLQEIYGDRLRAVVLFGSQARGEATEDSDVDVAVVLDDFDNAHTEPDRYADLMYDLFERHGELIMSVPMREREWRELDWRLYRNVRREGVLV